MDPIKLATTCLVPLMTALAFAEPPVFPGQEWATRTPEQSGLRPEVLARIDAHMRTSQANGVLIHHGYKVAEWTYGAPADTRFDSQSITKTITSLLLGLALREHRIRSLDSPVKEYYPDFFVGPYTDEITFRHLVTATSGIRATISNYVDPGNMKPGLESRYHNNHTHELGAALTYVFEQDLEEVLRERVLRAIGADMTWQVIAPVRPDGTTLQFSPGILEALNRKVHLADGREIRKVPFGLSRWSAGDLARVGWLCLNDGNWNGVQILPADYLRESRTPIPQPLFPFRLQRPGEPPQDMSRSAYGFLWRGYKLDDGRIIWLMAGNGQQFCLVLPELGIVMTKLNSWLIPDQVGVETIAPLVLDLVNKP